MDPVSLIVGALAAGAVAGLKKVASEAINDTYKALKSLIVSRYQSVDVRQLENAPDSKIARENLERDLKSSNADEDKELQGLAAKLAAAIKANADGKSAAHSIGLDIADVEYQLIKLGKVTAEGPGATGARIKKAKGGTLEVDEVNVNTKKN